MNNPIDFQVLWNGPQLHIIARYGQRPAWRIGVVHGNVGEDGIGFLADIEIDKEIEVKGGFLGLGKRLVSLRGKGIGSKLLEWFEREMGTHGVEEIRGNLVPETPDKLEWLIEWYRKREYEFHSGETAGEWAPPQTAGVVSKRIPLRLPCESRALGKVILDGEPGEP